MKLLGIAILAFAVVLVAGLQFAARTVTAQAQREAKSLGTAQRVLTSVSLRALDELQAGHVEQAKSFLAGNIAVYYHSIQQLDAPAEKKELLSHIESSSKTSPELRDALAKKPQ
jgi:hypothetical protein